MSHSSPTYDDLSLIYDSVIHTSVMYIEEEELYFVVFPRELKLGASRNRKVERTLVNKSFALYDLHFTKKNAFRTSLGTLVHTAKKNFSRMSHKIN